MLAASAAAIALPSGAGGQSPAAAAVQSHTMTLSSQKVSVVSQVYEPGQDSGWHAHSGIHAIAVVSGTLTIYDAQCRAQIIEWGRPYVGGQEVHRARNETTEPVQRVVTYVALQAVADSTRQAVMPPC